MQRIAELRREGLWSARRLPKVQEPPRNKTHWDYLLEEAQWLATDFVQERRWKKAAARKVSLGFLFRLNLGIEALNHRLRHSPGFRRI